MVYILSLQLKPLDIIDYTVILVLKFIILIAMFANDT